MSVSFTGRWGSMARGIQAMTLSIALAWSNLWAQSPAADPPQVQAVSGDQAAIAEPQDDDQASHQPAASVAAARATARVMYDTIRGALQVMHRDFFLEDESHTLPSQSLQDVFDNLLDDHGIRVNWITVNADEMNTDHRPAGKTELTAVKRLRGGATVYETSDSEAYHLVGAIRLSSQCLKCHVKHRKSLEPRMSGLHLQIPLARDNEVAGSGLRSTPEGEN